MISRMNKATNVVEMVPVASQHVTLRLQPNPNNVVVKKQQNHI